MANYKYEKTEINGKKEDLIVVIVKDLKTKKNLTYKFREFTIEEFSKVKLYKPEIGEEDTAATIVGPMHYMINQMMVIGEKLKKDTKMSIISQLKNALQPFLA